MKKSPPKVMVEPLIALAKPGEAAAEMHFEESAPDRGRWYDRLGAGAATACAIHCAALPVAAATLPALGLQFLATHEFELIFLASASLFATLSVVHSLRQHGRFFAWPFLVPGLAILWLERFFPSIHEQPVPHAVVMTIGGTLVAIAHLVNLRLAHGHVNDASCQHGHKH
jgi:hypothetical protein